MDGQLIDISGTMSGGGSRQQKGGMSSKAVKDHDYTEEHVVRFEKEREESEQTLKEIIQYKVELNEDLKTKQKFMSSFDMEISKLEMDMEHVRKQIDDTKAFIDSQKYLYQ